MSEFFAITSFLAAAVLVFVSLLKLLDAKFNALYATMLGMGGLVLVDIGKYYYLDQIRVGWLGDDAFQSVALLIWLSCASLLSAYLLSAKVIFVDRKKPKCSLLRRDKSNLLWLIKVLILPISFAYAYIFSKGEYGGIIIGGLLKGVIVSLLVYGIYNKDKAAILVSIAALITGVDDSSRRAYIAIYLPILVMMLYAFSEKAGRIKLKVKFLFSLLLLALFVFLNALRSEHDFGEGFNPDDKLANTLNYITTLKSVDTFYNTAFIYERFGSDWDYYYGETYLSVLVAPIPRFIWPDKPVSLGSQLGLMQALNYRGFDKRAWESVNMYSLSPGFVGEALANLGSMGVVIISILWGFLAAYFDKRLLGKYINAAATPWVIFLSSFVLVHRGDFYVSVNYQIFMFIAAILFFKVFYSNRLKPTFKNQEWIL